MVRVATWGMLLRGLAASGAVAENIQSDAEWPAEWTVFAPFDWANLVPDAHTLVQFRLDGDLAGETPKA